MSFFSKIGSALKSGVSKIGSGIKSAVTSVGSGIKNVVTKAGTGIKNFVTTAADKVKSGVKILGTNIKNSFSKESIKAFITGFAEGGLWNAIGSAVCNTAVMSMRELDKSGEWNPEYEYKQYGFPDAETFKEAVEYGAVPTEGKDAYSEYLRLGYDKAIAAMKEQGISGDDFVEAAAEEQGVSTTPIADGTVTKQQALSVINSASPAVVTAKSAVANDWKSEYNRDTAMYWRKSGTASPAVNAVSGGSAVTSMKVLTGGLDTVVYDPK